jgi:hypothetical protein
MYQRICAAQVAKFDRLLLVFVAIVVCGGTFVNLSNGQQPPGTIATKDSRCKVNGAQCNGVVSHCTFKAWQWNWWWPIVGGTCDICTTNGVITNWCFEDPNWDCVSNGDAEFVVCANRTRGQCVLNANSDGAVCAVVPNNPVIGQCSMLQCVGSLPHENPNNPQ